MKNHTLYMETAVILLHRFLAPEYCAVQYGTHLYKWDICLSLIVTQ